VSGLPRWDDPIESACAEAAVAVGRGLQVRPTLYGFEDGQPTLRVQPGLGVLHAKRADMHALLIGLVPVLGIRQILLFSTARSTDPDVPDPVLQDALATYGITVEVAERDGDGVTVDAHLLDHHVEGGEVGWSDPSRLDDCIWSATLRHALRIDSPLAENDRLGSFGMAYALSRQGMVVEVAPGWRDRYGFTRVPPRLERLVRPTDRRRARDLRRRHSRTQRPTSAAPGARRGDGR